MLIPSLLCHDIAETIAFYQAIGFELTGYHPNRDNPRWVELKRDGHTLQFYCDPPVGTLAQPQLSGTLYMRGENVDAIAADLSGNVQILWGPEDMEYGMRELGFRDPNGYVLAFTEPIA
ncbi:MAG: VOC family protein [Hyphomicrobiaceae bacterium]